VSVDLTPHLPAIPADLASALNGTYRDVMGHFLKGEWDDAQVDAGSFCEAALRYLEFRMTGSFTPIDCKSKPNRKTTVNKAQRDTNLPPSLRAQIVQSIELAMDFRNNRNSAHLGDIDANKLDATTAVQYVTWMIGEIVRLETQKPPAEVQRLLDQLAERHVPLVQTVNGRPIILQPKMEAATRRSSSSISRPNQCESRRCASGSGTRTARGGATRCSGVCSGRRTSTWRMARSPSSIQAKRQHKS
jgi:hypothetical protein